MIKTLLSLIFIIISLNANDKNNAKNSGSIAGQSAISKYGSKSGIQTNVTPLQTGGTLTSIDGKSTFNAKIGGCAENNEAIKIEILICKAKLLFELGKSEEVKEILEILSSKKVDNTTLKEIQINLFLNSIISRIEVCNIIDNTKIKVKKFIVNLLSTFTI